MNMRKADVYDVLVYSTVNPHVGGEHQHQKISSQ